jgi:hypothetical protein
MESFFCVYAVWESNGDAGSRAKRSILSKREEGGCFFDAAQSFGFGSCFIYNVWYKIGSVPTVIKSQKPCQLDLTPFVGILNVTAVIQCDESSWMTFFSTLS